MTTKIVLSDGVTELDGIKSCTFKEVVNADTDMRPGCVASASIEIEAYGEQNDAITAGEEITYYQVDSNGNDTLIGVFYAEPTISTRNTYKFVAYDVVSKLDVDFSARLNAIQGSFPMTLSALVGEACTVAGVTLTGTFPMSSTTIQAFQVDGVTCRQILSWAAEIACRFVRARSDGTIEFAWYATATAYRVYPSDGSANNETFIYYKQDGLHYENYTTSALDRVVIHPTDDDGTEYVYPANTSSGNTIDITNNLLLTGSTSATYTAVAQNIYTVMTATGTYRPAQLALFPFNNPFRAGDIVKVTDIQGVSFVTPVMSMTVSAEAAHLGSTGNEEYSVSANAVSKEIAALSDNIVRLKKLKVDWADITTAVINTLVASGIYTDWMNTSWINAGVVNASRIDFPDYGSISVTSVQNPFSGQTVSNGWISSSSQYLALAEVVSSTNLSGKRIVISFIASPSSGYPYCEWEYNDPATGTIIIEPIEESTSEEPSSSYMDAYGNVHGGVTPVESSDADTLTDEKRYTLYFDVDSGHADSRWTMTIGVKQTGVKVRAVTAFIETSASPATGYASDIHLGYDGLQIGDFAIDPDGNATDTDGNVVSGTSVLWTNSDPTVSFAAQTLTIANLSDYNLFTVVCGRNTTNPEICNSTECYVPATTQTMYDLSHGAVDNSYNALIRQRNVWFTRSANTARFSAGWVTGGSGDDNTQMIPLYILGKKI